MYETLALSAFHLSVQNSAKSSLYLAESTALQAHALSLFNSSSPTADKDNIIPAFLFSALLGLHFFCHTFVTPSSDLDTFLDRLVQSIRLLRGVRALIGDSWEVIKSSDIDILLQVHEGPVVDRDDEVNHAFEDLRTRLSQSYTLSAFEAHVYCEAIASMIWLHNSQASSSVVDGRSNARVVATWPIQISSEYTELLVERKPEALVVMAYFSILLHGKREFWAVGNAGRLLLSAIVEYLGDDWAEWLAVPRSMVPSLDLRGSPTARTRTSIF